MCSWLWVAQPPAPRITKPEGCTRPAVSVQGNSCLVSESREFWLPAIHVVVVAADHRHVADRLNFGEQRPIATYNPATAAPLSYNRLDSARMNPSALGPAVGVSGTRYAAESPIRRHHFDMNEAR
jgi:hypothetical protein